MHIGCCARLAAKSMSSPKPSFTAMWPSPPRPTTPSLRPGLSCGGGAGRTGRGAAGREGGRGRGGTGCGINEPAPAARPAIDRPSAHYPLPPRRTSPKWRRGDQIVMPAHRSGAAASMGRLEGRCSTNLQGTAGDAEASADSTREWLPPPALSSCSLHTPPPTHTPKACLRCSSLTFR